MKRISMILVLFFLTEIGLTAQQSKMDLWRKPSFFRGYNVIRENPKTLQDFIDLKSSGANFAYIGIDGFYKVDSPY